MCLGPFISCRYRSVDILCNKEKNLPQTPDASASRVPVVLTSCPCHKQGHVLINNTKMKNKSYRGCG